MYGTSVWDNCTLSVRPYLEMYQCRTAAVQVNYHRRAAVQRVYSRDVRTTGYPEGTHGMPIYPHRTTIDRSARTAKSARTVSTHEEYSEDGMYTYVHVQGGGTYVGGTTGGHQVPRIHPDTPGRLPVTDRLYPPYVTDLWGFNRVFGQNYTDCPVLYR